MAKQVIKIVNQDECIGCEMCVMEVQKQLGKAGLSGSPIRVFRNTRSAVRFQIDLDPNSKIPSKQDLISICPKAVFELITLEDDEV